MEQGSEPEERINLILFRESIWELEDKVNVIMESIADQEAEAIRLRRLTRLGCVRNFV